MKKGFFNLNDLLSTDLSTDIVDRLDRYFRVFNGVVTTRNRSWTYSILCQILHMIEKPCHIFYLLHDLSTIIRLKKIQHDHIENFIERYIFRPNLHSSISYRDKNGVNFRMQIFNGYPQVKRAIHIYMQLTDIQTLNQKRPEYHNVLRGNILCKLRLITYEKGIF